MQTATQELQRLDLVKTLGGAEFIITDHKPTRPAYPYLGVKPRGNGAEYKIGPKNRPMKIGTVSEDHPALQALAARKGHMSPSAKDMLRRLFDAVEAGKLEVAQALVPGLRDQV
jgi:hypothetical protein